MRERYGEPLHEYGRDLQWKIRRWQQVVRWILGLLQSAVTLRLEDP